MSTVSLVPVMPELLKSDLLKTEKLDIRNLRRMLRTSQSEMFQKLRKLKRQPKLKLLFNK